MNLIFRGLCCLGLVISFSFHASFAESSVSDNKANRAFNVANQKLAQKSNRQPNSSSNGMMNIVKIKNESAKKKSMIQSYLLTYPEFKKLNKKDRINYLRSVSKALIQMSPKSNKTAFEILFPDVYAREDEGAAQPAAGFRCIGGGVPVPAGGDCGVQSYAGFSCEAGLNICNPLLFGVKEDSTPFCFKKATTELCYKKVSPGKNSSLDLVFEKEGNKEAYEKFSKDIGTICYHVENEGAEPKVQIKEGPVTLAIACEYVRKQTAINRERGLAGYKEDEKPERSTKDDEDVILENVLPASPAAKPESDSTVDDNPMDYNLF